MFFKKIFKNRKAKELKSKLDIIRDNSKSLFQMDIIRDGFVDLQVFRQINAKDFGLDFIDPDGFMIFFIFDQKKNNNYQHFENFKNSEYYNKMKYSLLGNDKFNILFIDSNFELMNITLNNIQNDIYLYEKGEPYEVIVNVL